MTIVPVSVLGMAVVAGLALASAALSVLAVWRVQCLSRSAAGTRAGAAPQFDATIGALEHRIGTLQQEIDELRRRGPAAVPQSAPRSGINLDKRSQALRMHRRGESAAEIAAALDLPVPEVNLLFKVHRIVLHSI